MKKVFVLFLSLTVPFITKSQTKLSDSLYLLLPYDSIQVFDTYSDRSFELNVMIGVWKRYRAFAVTQDQLKSWNPNSSDTMEVASLRPVKSDDCCDYYPMKLFPSGRIKIIADYLIWPMQFLDTTRKKPYFLFRKM